MALQTAILAPDRAVKARDDQIERCQQIDDSTDLPDGSLSGWRAGLAGVLVAFTFGLIAIPLAAVVDPALLGRASRLLSGLAGVTPLTLGLRALVFVVALVVITRPDGKA